MFAVIGGLSYSLLWYVALSNKITEFGGTFSSNFCVGHFMYNVEGSFLHGSQPSLSSI